MRQLAIAATLCLALAACAPEPFDATASWEPLRPTGEGRAYEGGMMSSQPRNVFDEFEQDAQDGPQSTLPNPRRGENPWATIPENPVVTVCYGPGLNSRESVEAAARRLCPEGARLEYLESSTFQSDCPLLQPTRAAFRCRTGEPGDADADAGQ